MEALRERRPAADGPTGQPAPRELVNRIGKLRWLGMQEEAERLHMTLRRVPYTNCVIVAPRDTD